MADEGCKRLARILLRFFSMWLASNWRRAASLAVTDLKDFLGE